MNVIDCPSREAINNEAALWHARLDSGTADTEQFDAWREADPAHAAAFARIAATADALDELRGLTFADDPDLREAQTIDRRQFLPWAAAVVVAAGGVGLWGATQARASASTPIGGRKTVRLPDGGQLDLNTDTRVSWKFDRSSRRIWLERGEIALAVPADSRPCLLFAAGQTITMASGGLNARLRNPAVDITVTNGECAVKAQSVSGSRTGTTLVRAGEAALSAADMTRVRQLSDSDLQFTTGWRNGELIFDGQTLRVAVAEYNRYLENKITIIDPELADIHLGGRFVTHDPKDFLAALEGSFRIRVQRLPNGAVALTR